MIAKFSLPIACTILISGCAAPSATLVNKEGQQQVCASSGFGWLGAPVAVAMYADCVKHLEAQGFQKVDDIGEKSRQVLPVKMEDAEYSVAMRPVFEGGEYWEYHETGARSGIYKATVKGKEVARGSAAYLVSINDIGIQVLDSDLNMVEVRENGSVALEMQPSMKIFAWPLKVGQTWNASGIRTTASGDSLKFDMDVTVADYGLVTVPAGNFEAFYIKAQGTRGGALAQEVWYSPEVRNVVKRIAYFREGKLVDELISYGTNGQPAPVRKKIITKSENDVAVLCAELGFSMGSPEYKNCTLKAEKIQR